jgi:hypothetical protein
MRVAGASGLSSVETGAASAECFRLKGHRMREGIVDATLRSMLTTRI